MKLIDFGESFFSYERPKGLHTPLALRAPEALFDEEFDFRVDRWTFACAVAHTHTTLICSLLIYMLDFRTDRRVSAVHRHHGKKGRYLTTDSGHDRRTARRMAA